MSGKILIVPHDRGEDRYYIEDTHGTETSARYVPVSKAKGWVTLRIGTLGAPQAVIDTSAS